ncbi:hypothetical protein ACHWQZ_G000883 [Mnemiopsis leidyi]
MLEYVLLLVFAYIEVPKINLYAAEERNQLDIEKSSAAEEIEKLEAGESENESQIGYREDQNKSRQMAAYL